MAPARPVTVRPVSPHPVTRRVLLRGFAAGTSVFGTFLLPPALHGGMVNRAMAHQATASRHGSAAASPPPDRHAAAQMPNTQLPNTGSPRIRPPLVMLDPGHGGKDPGAIGVGGTFEKHVSLATAMELKHQLESGGRYRVELTRTRDVFIPLDGRVELAQQRGAALFVSMHADALSDHSVRGASVYTLAQTASDAQTAALARTENSADRFTGHHWENTSPEVSQILASLVRQETRVGSVRIARHLVGSLDQDLPMLQNPDRHAGFVVLKAADIPSVLVEMGFMSNPTDEAALSHVEHRRLVAQAMRRAVDAFFTGSEHMADNFDPGWG